jgi:predicted O-methyltransferase YrrM
MGGGNDHQRRRRGDGRQGSSEMNTPEVILPLLHDENGFPLPVTAYSQNRILIEMFSSTEVQDHNGEIYPLHSNISAPEGLFLKDLIQKNNCKKSLEIGFAFGISTIFICEALAGNGEAIEHKAIDHTQQSYWKGIGLNNIRRAGYDSIFQFIDGRAEFCLPSLAQVGFVEKFDFIFIDGSHDFEDVLVNFYYCDRMLKPGGILVFDDAHFPGVGQVVSHIAQTPRYSNFQVLRYLEEAGEGMDKMAAFKKERINDGT